MMTRPPYILVVEAPYYAHIADLLRGSLAWIFLMEDDPFLDRGGAETSAPSDYALIPLSVQF